MVSKVIVSQAKLSLLYRRAGGSFIKNFFDYNLVGKSPRNNKQDCKGVGHARKKPHLPICACVIRKKKHWGFCYCWCGRAWETINLLTMALSVNFKGHTRAVAFRWTRGWFEGLSAFVASCRYVHTEHGAKIKSGSGLGTIDPHGPRGVTEMPVSDTVFQKIYALACAYSRLQALLFPFLCPLRVGSDSGYVFAVSIR